MTLVGLRTVFWLASHKEDTTRKTYAWMGGNIKMYLMDIGCGGVDWVNLARDRDQWRAMMVNETLSSIKFREFG